MADEREARRLPTDEIEGHGRRRANESGPDAENADAQTSEASRRANEEPDAGEPEIEGHKKLK